MSRAIIEAVGQALPIDGSLVTIGTSIGVALSPQHGTDPTALLKAADVALYRAKAEGRNTFCIFDEAMAQAIEERWVLKTMISQSLAEGLFWLGYQPVVDLRTGQLAGFEALLRCSHPAVAAQPVSMLIEVAEETGLIVQIGEWALRSACEAARGWPSHLFVAVNLSPVQFRDGRLPAIVRNALADADLPASRLHLEITETVPLHSNAGNVAQLSALRQLGPRIVLDDFGTGYSSLSYLRSFQFDALKLDRSFVAGFQVQPEAHAIARAVVALAHGLGLHAVGEGVETAEQARALQRKGYRYAQGHLFGTAVDRRAAGALAADPDLTWLIG